MTLTPGTRLGSYEIVSALGAGGMGEVYRARDARIGRDVAIKVLPQIFSLDSERLARFEREARLLGALNHPNIGAIYGLEDAGGIRGLVLELVDGPTLADRLREGPLPVAEALAIARQIADALDAAHEKGIVHRDLKPANIKITPDGTVKVLDFGLAKAVADEASAPDLSKSPTITSAGTREGIILGTAAYMSPEQARGKPVDKRADVWAFGCVLYEMLTGRAPFPGDTVSDVIAAIIEREPAWQALPSVTPPGVQRVLHRCLDKDPKRRLRDIGDARADLEAAHVTPQTTAASGLRHAPNRERVAWIVAVVLLLILAAGAMLRRPSSPRVQPPRLTRATRVAAEAATEFGAAISPDGKWVAYLSNKRGSTDVWVKFLTGGEAVNLTAATSLFVSGRGDLGGLSVSPDGSLIAFSATQTAGAPPTVYDAWVIPAPVGGVPRKIVERGSALRWSPDGTRLTYVRPGASAGDALFVADADGQNAREIVSPRGGMHVHWPAWSADGHAIYFNYTIGTSNSEPAEIYRVAAGGGPIEPVVRTSRRAVFPALTPDGSGLVYAANPTTAELGLWWRALGKSSSDAIPLTTGVGEYAEPVISSDGRSIVATLVQSQESLVLIPANEPAGPRALTEAFPGDVDPAISPRGDRMVFSSTRAGNRNLWLARTDGTGARPLTAGTVIDERPIFSPDGQVIAFVSDRGGERGIWIMSAEGGAPRLLVQTLVLDSMTWSPDSGQIVYSAPAGDAPALFTVNVNDGKVSLVRTPGLATAPAWSPRGDVIAYLEAVQATARTGAFTRLAFVTPAGEPRPVDVKSVDRISSGILAWSPDGARLVAIGNPGIVPSSVWIVTLGPPASARKVVELPLEVRIRGASWLPDGTGVIAGQRRRLSDVVLFESGDMKR